MSVMVLSKLLLVQAGAPASEPVRFEAETMSHGSFASVTTDAKHRPSGNKALHHECGGQATECVQLPTPSETIVVRARNGTTSTTAVGLRVLVDGSRSAPRRSRGKPMVLSLTISRLRFPLGITR